MCIRDREPRLPDLKWLDPGDTVFIGSLESKALDLLVDSPDARRLCEWLDVQTDRKATILQMTMALRMLGHLPGGPEPEQVGAGSAGLQHFEAFAFQTGTDTRHAEKRLCPHCGQGLDADSGLSGHIPSAGDLSVCVYCCGFMTFGESLELLPLGEADLEALEQAGHGDVVATLREMRDLFRASRLGKLKSGVQA